MLSVKEEVKFFQESVSQSYNTSSHFLSKKIFLLPKIAFLDFVHCIFGTSFYSRQSFCYKKVRLFFPSHLRNSSSVGNLLLLNFYYYSRRKEKRRREKERERE